MKKKAELLFLEATSILDSAAETHYVLYRIFKKSYSRGLRFNSNIFTVSSRTILNDIDFLLTESACWQLLL